jgi:enoyl-CoA hydratase/carnithine racemase
MPQSFALLRELVSAAQQIKKDRSIRVVILDG